MLTQRLTIVKLDFSHQFESASSDPRMKLTEVDGEKMVMRMSGGLKNSIQENEQQETLHNYNGKMLAIDELE